MEKLVYQMFILGEGKYLRGALEKGLGGVIFFSRDIQTEEQFKNMLRDIKNNSLIPPFLSIDQEGGRVERTENLYPKRLSARYAFQKGEAFLTKQTEEIASELKDFGINLNFAPVADVNTNPSNPIIGERAFSDRTEEVIKGVNLVSRIYRKNGIIPCVKHFPGHGDADSDSHLTLPRIDLPIEEMEKIHIKPFKSAVENGIEMVMAAHLHCTCFDKKTIPASLSKNAIGYLRNVLNYDGVVISDDMVMKGVQAYGSFDAVRTGIEAGLDMFIFREADENAVQTIENLVKAAGSDKNLADRIVRSNERIMALKQKFSLI